MKKSRICVGVTQNLPEPTQTRLQELFDVQLRHGDQALSHTQLCEMAASCQVMCPTVTDVIDRKVLEAGAGNLRLLANFGAGTDHIDLDAAAKAGITVTNTPDVLTDDTADLTMALILAVPRRLVEGTKVLRDGGYVAGWSPTWMMGRSLGGKKLGIVGMGRIGQAIAARARAFGMQIHYHNRKQVSTAIEESLQALYWPDLDAMLGEMDFVSLNCPLTNETHHLMDTQRLHKMARHAVLINSARGKLIDEKALADALEAGVICGAGLDVFEFEPRVEPRLLQMENVVALPHLGSSTLEARAAMGDRMIINIQAFADGHKPPNRVISALGNTR